MKLFIGYASTQGHTRKIARHIGDRLVDAGHGVEIAPLSDTTDLDITRFDGVILGASVHVSHYQKALTHFVHEQVTDLATRPTLLLSVSLAAAGHDAEDWRGLDKIVADFCEATGWTPGQVAQIAGAYTPSRYDIVTRFVMRRIIAHKDPDADLDADRDYTDWAALDALVDGWVAGITP
jgi:menaquinone-dependent protoporphyrinogen oxidase